MLSSILPLSKSTRSCQTKFLRRINGPSATVINSRNVISRFQLAPNLNRYNMKPNCSRLNSNLLAITLIRQNNSNRSLYGVRNNKSLRNNSKRWSSTNNNNNNNNNKAYSLAIKVIQLITKRIICSIVKAKELQFTKNRVCVKKLRMRKAIFNQLRQLNRRATTNSKALKVKLQTKSFKIYNSKTMAVETRTIQIKFKNVTTFKFRIPKIYRCRRYNTLQA